MICAVPIGQKCRHHIVVVDFSLHFCLPNEQWIQTRVRYEISASLVFLNLKNVLIEISSIEIFSISSYPKKLMPATSYRSDKQVHVSNNQFTNGILTWFDCKTCELFWAIFAFTTLSSSWNMALQPKYFFTALGTERSQRAFTSKFFIICSCSIKARQHQLAVFHHKKKHI